MLTGNKHRWSLFLQAGLTLVAIYGVLVYKNEGELIRRLESRHRMQEVLGTVLGAMDVGYWEWDFRTDKVEWSPTLYQIFGLPENGNRAYNEWLRVLHPDDRELADSVCREAARLGEPYVMHYRILLEDGSVRHVMETAAVDVIGRRMVGACKVYEKEPSRQSQAEAEEHAKGVLSQ